MAKVLGAILTLAGTITSLMVLFLYLNSSAVLPYHPADGKGDLFSTGLALPVVVSAFILITGIVILAASTEPESN